MESFWSGDAPGNLYWAHVWRFCSKPAGQSGFRAPPDQKRSKTQTGNVADECSNRGRNNQATPAHSDRRALSHTINNVTTKTRRSNVWLAAWVFALIGQDEQMNKLNDER